MTEGCGRISNGQIIVNADRSLFTAGCYCVAKPYAGWSTVRKSPMHSSRQDRSCEVGLWQGFPEAWHCSGRITGLGARDDTCGDIVGPGKGRLGPRTYLQPFGDPQPLASPPAWKRMPGKDPRLSASMDGLRGTRIGQTHNDISGPIIGQMRLDQFALQSVKRTTT